MNHSLFLSALILALGISFAQDPNLYVYLAFGQSNMFGDATIEEVDKSGVDSRFRNLSAVTCGNRTMGQWIAGNPPLVQCNSGLSVVDYFGRTLVENLPSTVSVGVSIVAVPGAKIELFDKTNYQSYADTVPQWMKNYAANYGKSPYARLVEMGKKAKQAGVIKGILLHQGESNNGEDETWLNKVKKIYDELMQDLELDPAQVPLIAGEVVGKNEGGACWYINGTIAKLPTKIPNAHVVSSAELPHKGDNLHFTAAAYRTFGSRYAQIALQILNSAPTVVIPSHRDTVFNGSFELDTQGWTFNTWGGSATGTVIEGEYQIDVQQAGTASYQIQLIQAGLILQKGKSYLVSFDAHAPMPRPIEVNVEEDTDPWPSYLPKRPSFALTSSTQNYSFLFTMEAPTDSSARLSFNAAESMGTLFLDNISIREVSSPTGSTFELSPTPPRIYRHGIREFDMLGR